MLWRAAVGMTFGHQHSCASSLQEQWVTEQRSLASVVAAATLGSPLQHRTKHMSEGGSTQNSHASSPTTQRHSNALRCGTDSIKRRKKRHHACHAAPACMDAMFKCFHSTTNHLKVFLGRSRVQPLGYQQHHTAEPLQVAPQEHLQRWIPGA
jgi:hypothetical protein